MKVVHVIGLVGAGKTTFINKWFPKIPDVFDIKTVYEQHDFSPENLQGNPQLYASFKQVLKEYLLQFIEKSEELGFFIAESSGANGIFNQLFKELDEYRIWIEPDFVRIKKVVETQRGSYAKDLNEYIIQKFNHGEIMYHNSYNTNTNAFSKPLPDFLKKYLNKNRI